MLDVSEFLIEKGWQAVPTGWINPTDRTVRSMREALNIQVKRDAVALDDALEACRLALPVVETHVEEVERLSYDWTKEYRAKAITARDKLRAVVEASDEK